MGFINGLSAFLTVIAFILLIVGMINPKWVKMKSRGKSFLLYFIAMIVFALIFDATMSEEARSKQKKATQVTTQNSEEPARINEKVSQATVDVSDVSQTAAAVPSEKSESGKEVAVTEHSLTGPQKNAIRSAQQYLSFTGFSRDGLIQQLSSSAGNGYDRNDATVAVDSLNIDWNEQAVKSATNYLNLSGFSCKGLIQQLSSRAGDKYTVDQATYGAKKAGACS
ncbi:hypothetical protein F889_01323 [Acinetobacter colistiniresistens]|uniref:Putative host cell surface-exposed lipoprotein Ltp-like HTH region domain-containing protein n=1 Tax=Acinetobacter colistiniresistens TaxID=280145 RepID=N9R7C8_9GAMM|nr:Ltp family lipoprotein [Acinetobacter colistiniresistens]ENX35032.1 hypothetical protein F889_01323 [Acinetobacter colistiniresistens]